MAQDFLDLSFQLESGRPLPFMTRFDGPIRIRVAGSPPPTLSGDLDRLITRLRREARLDIARSTAGSAEIVVEALPTATLKRYAPEAACFVVPNVSGFEDYKRKRRTDEANWALLTERRKASIFLPSDQSPQEIRDCLHEEIAQAIGPLNDLYRLPDSVFNDDNYHTVLTGFDMLMLRTYYAPELSNRMTKSEAAKVVPRILARYNQRGQQISGRPPAPTPRAWIDAIEIALGANSFTPLRRSSAQKAVQIAAEAGWSDTRRGLSHDVFGRLSLAQRPDVALTSFLTAHRLYRASPVTDVQTAHVALQLAAATLSAGQSEETLALVTPSIRIAERAENASLLATLLMLKSAALTLQGRDAEAQAARLDSFGWGLYGLGSERAVQARWDEVRALSPRSQGETG
jgi:hypothetical protein